MQQIRKYRLHARDRTLKLSFDAKRSSIEESVVNPSGKRTRFPETLDGLGSMHTDLGGEPTSFRLGGRTLVRIRSIRPTDVELEREFFYSLSPETRYRRLLSGRDLMPGELERLTNVDELQERALIAVAHIDGAERELGVARCAREPADADIWDLAIVVRDEYQRKGLGELLLRRLMRSARDTSAVGLSGLTLAYNVPMLALARKLGFVARRETGDANLIRLSFAFR